MRYSRRFPSWLVVSALAPLGLVLAACAEGDPAAPPGSGPATVRFEYAASTSIDPAVAQAFPACVQGVGQTHIHPGWRNFARVNMQAVGADRWEIEFTDVPVGAEQRIRVSDPNVCAENPTGAATRGVRANGVLLTRVVDTPGSGIEPGLAFSVATNGTVTP